MCGYSSHSLRRVSPYSLFYSHFNTISPICRKTLYYPFHWCPQNNFGAIMHIKAYFKISATQKPWLIQKNRIKIMIVISKIKYKSNTMLGVNRNLVLDFILYFVTAYIRKCPIHVISAQGTIQNTLYITWGMIYNSKYTQTMFKVITIKNDRVTI